MLYNISTYMWLIGLDGVVVKKVFFHDRTNNLNVHIIPDKVYALRQFCGKSFFVWNAIFGAIF